MVDMITDREVITRFLISNSDFLLNIFCNSLQMALVSNVSAGIARLSSHIKTISVQRIYHTYRRAAILPFFSFEVIKSSTWVSLTFGILIPENMVKAPDAGKYSSVHLCVFIAIEFYSKFV